LIHELGESSFKNEERRHEVLEEHKRIIKAIKKRDIDAAAKYHGCTTL
jgi:DNA-binding FadR family transcriptional regulator